MPLIEEVRSSCAQIAAHARWVQIDENALAGDALAAIAARGPGPALDPVRHYLEGEPADVADYLLALDAINFGSGWFPTLRKRLDGGHPVSGYFTVAWALADHVRGNGPPTPAWLRGVDTRTVAQILDQPPSHELMSLYAQALRELGRFLGDRRALDVVAQCGGSARARHPPMEPRPGTRVQGPAAAPVPVRLLLKATILTALQSTLAKTKVTAMATLTIRGLDDETKTRLRVRAARHGRSMEAEVRAILEDALPFESSSGGLGSRVHARFAAIGGMELDPPVRREAPRAASLQA
ncbi:MAG: FitA-like ribbon-helix-helix domain-containing protein [Solirubrobacteraceae bacterium]